MLRSPALLRRALLVMLAVAALGATSACDGVTPNAATVGGHAVTRKQVFADLRAETIAAAKAGPNTTAADGSPFVSPKGQVQDSYTTAASSAAVNGRVLYLLYGELLARFKGTVTSADTSAARTALCTDSSTGQAPTDGSCAPLADYPAAYRTFQINLRARRIAFSTALAKTSFPAVKAGSPASLRQLCVDVAQVADEATGNSIVAAVEKGSTLTAAAVAAGQSKANPTPQHACVYVSQLPDTVLKTKPGHALFLQTSSSLLVLVVTGRQTATAKEFSTNPPTDDAKVSAIVEKLAKKVIVTIPVSIDPRFGTWDGENLAVLAPKRPAGMVTTTTSPLTAVGGSTPTP